MNGLSWIFYLADVSDGVDWIAASTTFILVVAGIILLLSALIASYVAGDDESDHDERESAKGWIRVSGTLTKWLVPLLVGAFLLQALLPTRQTFMLIASSEIGENILSSDKAQQIGGETGELVTDTLKMLRKYVNEQLGEAAPKAEEPAK